MTRLYSRSIVNLIEVCMHTPSKINDIRVLPDVNDLLTFLTHEIHRIIGSNLVGIYLFGSLTYDDFNRESSDIDIVVVSYKTIDSDDINLLLQLHGSIASKFNQWSERLEVSYTPIHLFEHTMPPLEPRPYYGGGKFYDNAPYGNEWIINNYLLSTHGIALAGPDFKELIRPIDIIEVQKACVRDLFQEWKPKMTDYEWLDNSHYQAYLILNLCRILYTVMCGATASKSISSDWVKKQYPQWTTLVETAQNWRYGIPMKLQDEAIQFINFALEEIKCLPLYHDINYAVNSHGMTCDLSLIADFLARVNEWVTLRQDIVGLALAGSYARNEARPDSDVDLIVLTANPNDYISNKQWLTLFGIADNARLEHYGAVVSWHVHYKAGHEVEFGLALPGWADLPIDPGTRDVIADGIIIFYDPDTILEKLIRYK